MGIRYHFFDSGSFTLNKEARKFQKRTGRHFSEYYRTKRVQQFLDAYAQFILDRPECFDFYSNVDAIYLPDATWRHQQYLEKKYGLTPIPVVHLGTDLKWLRHYMELGYDYISLGGLVGQLSKSNTVPWIDACFDMIADSQGLPQVKLHGFGMTSLVHVRRWPWYSVDSSSWQAITSFGNILVPHKRRGQFVFDERPYMMCVSEDARPGKKQVVKIQQHYKASTPSIQKLVLEWLECVGVSLQDVSEKGGYKKRAKANILFYHHFAQSLPPWPWPHRKTTRPTLWQSVPHAS